MKSSVLEWFIAERKIRFLLIWKRYSLLPLLFCSLLSSSYNEELPLRFHHSSMSQRTNSSSTNPSKRSPSPFSSSSATNTPAAASAAAPPIFPAMKKAKSQAVACSVDGNKNGQQQTAPHVHFAENPALSPMIEDDPNDVVLEGSSPSSAFGRGVSSSGGGITANLARKKATPPQPSKKLVIKLVKGMCFCFPSLPIMRFSSSFKCTHKIRDFCNPFFYCMCLFNWGEIVRVLMWLVCCWISFSGTKVNRWSFYI